MKFNDLSRTESFLPGILRNEDIYPDPEIYFDSCLFTNLVIFAYHFSKFFTLQFEPKNFHVYVHTSIGCMYLDLISY